MFEVEIVNSVDLFGAVPGDGPTHVAAMKMFYDRIAKMFSEGWNPSGFCAIPGGYAVLLWRYVSEE